MATGRGITFNTMITLAVNGGVKLDLNFVPRN